MARDRGSSMPIGANPLGQFAEWSVKLSLDERGDLRFKASLRTSKGTHRVEGKGDLYEGLRRLRQAAGVGKHWKPSREN